MKFHSFEHVASVIEVAEKTYAQFCTRDEERYKILKNYCDALDKVIEEFNGISLNIEVKEGELTIWIKLECIDISIDKPKHVLYELLKRTIEFDFSSTPDHHVLITFVFPSIWE